MYHELERDSMRVGSDWNAHGYEDHAHIHARTNAKHLQVYDSDCLMWERDSVPVSIDNLASVSTAFQC